MSALVKKEIRLLLPSWLAVLLLEIVLPWFSNEPDSMFAVIPFFVFFGTIILAVDSFGREFSLGTFPSLLAQPMERRQIWRTKIAVLIFAAALIFAGFFISCELLFHHALKLPVWGVNPKIIGSDFRHAMLGSGVVMLIALVGGLWTTLLLRQAAAAFWITFLAPAGLLMLIVLFLPAKLASDDYVVFALLYSMAVIYIVAGFWFAHRLFHRAQDAEWTGGVIAFSKWRYFENAASSTDSTRHWRPLAALAKKELQLQSITWFCAAALLALHVAVIVMRKVHGSFERDSIAGGASEFFWTLWLVMPLIIGGTVVAEERRLGVTEAQFCLPASRRLQFAVKFFPTLFFGIFLGGVLPLLLETFAAYFGAPNPDFNPFKPDRDFIGAAAFFIALSFGLSVAGFLASTLTKNFLQALGAVVVIIIGSVLFTSFAGQLHSFFGFFGWNPVLTIALTILTALVVVPSLAYRNFIFSPERERVWRRNVFGLTAAILFILIASAALYNRVWEMVEPAEPPHGPAKLSLAQPQTLHCDNWYNLLVCLPDGRVWFGDLRYEVPASNASRLKWFWHYLLSPLPISSGMQRFVGSNWVASTVRHVDFYGYSKPALSQTKNHVVGYLDTVGIQKDGTLWISDASKNGDWNGKRMSRFGGETNWQQLVRAQYEVLLLKNDGTLWGWGPGHFDWSNLLTNWPSLHAYRPHQIGTDTDWKEIYTSWNNHARKADGSVWSIRESDRSFQDELHLETNLDQVSLPTLSQGFGEMAYVRPDGTLWMRWLQQGKDMYYTDFVRVGTETNWTSVALNEEKMVALKSDGSLWEWRFFNHWNLSQRELAAAAQQPPARLGIHSDWVAIANTWQAVIALAADGSLWLWPNREHPGQSSLLKLPKQPGFLGNVFSPQP